MSYGNLMGFGVSKDLQNRRTGGGLVGHYSEHYAIENHPSFNRVGSFHFTPNTECVQRLRGLTPFCRHF